GTFLKALLGMASMIRSAAMAACSSAMSAAVSSYRLISSVGGGAAAAVSASSRTCGPAQALSSARVEAAMMRFVTIMRLFECAADSVLQCSRLRLFAHRGLLDLLPVQLRDLLLAF